MLTVNSGIDYKKTNVSFGTNLTLGKGVVDHLNKHPEELKKIQDFKNYLANDGKNWNAELTYDTFTPQKPKAEDVEALIRKEAQGYDPITWQQTKDSVSRMEPKDAASLIEKLAQDPDGNVKREAIESIKRINNSDVAISLIDKLIQSPSDEAKEHAVYALTEIDDKAKRDAKIKQFLNSDNVVIKRSAARTLAKAQGFEITDEMIQNLSKDTDPDVRGIAVSLIADFEDERYAKNPKLYDSIIEKALDDPNDWAKYYAFSNIGKISDPQKAVALIEKIANSDISPWHRGTAVRSVQYIKDSQLAKETVEKFLQHPDYEIQTGAASAAVNIKDQKIKTEFMEKLSDNPIVGIRREVVWGLNDLEDSNKKVALIEKFVKDSEPEIRERAVSYTGTIEDDKQRNKLITKYIKSPDLNIRKGVVEALGDVIDKEPEKAKEYATIMLQDSSKYIQKEAKEKLERIKFQEQKDSYNLKINDGDKVLGQKKVQEPRYGEVNFLEAFFNTYKRIVENAKTN